MKKGGHNILEPAALGKPVLFGPYMFNFRDIRELFLSDQAGIEVIDEHDLEAKIKDLLLAITEKEGRFRERKKGKLGPFELPVQNSLMFEHHTNMQLFMLIKQTIVL